MFNNDLVAIRKSKIALTLNKSTCIRIWILDLSEKCELILYE